MRPAFWRTDVELIKLSIDAMTSKCIRELQHALAVLRGVVAVADEDSAHWLDPNRRNTTDQELREARVRQ